MSQWHIAVLYLDDSIVYSQLQGFEEHEKNLGLVFDRLENAEVKKFSFFEKEASFLGHIVSAE